MTIPIIPNPLGQVFDVAGDSIAEIIKARTARKKAEQAEAEHSLSVMQKLGIFPQDAYNRPDVQALISKALGTGKTQISGAMPILPNPKDNLAGVASTQATNLAATPESEAAHAATGIPSAAGAALETRGKAATASEAEARASLLGSEVPTEEEKKKLMDARIDLISTQANIAKKDLDRASRDVETQGAITKQIQTMLADPKSGLGRAAAFSSLGALGYITGLQNKQIAAMNRDEQRMFMLGNQAMGSAATEYRQRLEAWETRVANYKQANPNWAKVPRQKEELDALVKQKPNLGEINALHLQTIYQSQNLDPLVATEKFGESIGMSIEKGFPQEKQDLFEKIAQHAMTLPPAQREAYIQSARTKALPSNPKERLIASPHDYMVLRMLVDGMSAEAKKDQAVQ